MIPTPTSSVISPAPAFVASTRSADLIERNVLNLSFSRAFIASFMSALICSTRFIFKVVKMGLKSQNYGIIDKEKGTPFGSAFVLVF